MFYQVQGNDFINGMNIQCVLNKKPVLAFNS
jgi:hypothetical protein